MILLELIGELIGRLFLEILFQGIVLRAYKASVRGVRFVKAKVFGIEIKPTDHIKALEKTWLHKKIQLTDNLNSDLNTKQMGKVIKVLNKNAVLAEFYDSNGDPIELNNEKAFMVRITQLRKKR